MQESAEHNNMAGGTPAETLERLEQLVDSAGARTWPGIARNARPHFER